MIGGRGGRRYGEDKERERMARVRREVRREVLREVRSVVTIRRRTIRMGAP